MRYLLGHPRRGTGTPPVVGQPTSITWLLSLSLSITADGAGGGSINYQEGLADFRADFYSQLTSANAPVSAWTSGQSLPSSLSQGTAANQPTHSDGLAPALTANWLFNDPAQSGHLLTSGVL